MNKRVWYYYMSDKKNDIDKDFEKKLVKIANAKLRQQRLSNNIYERFISRVQSDNDNSDETEHVKPLESAEKLCLFTAATSPAKDGSDNRDSDDIDKERLDKGLDDQHLDDISDRETEETFFVETDQLADVPSTQNMPTLEDQSVSIEPNIENNRKSVKPLASSQNSLIVGMIFGSLLIATIVCALIFTGVLSTAPSAGVDSNIADNADVTTAINKEPATSTISATKKEEDPVATDTNTTAEIPALSQQPSNNDKKTAPANSEDTQTAIDNADSRDSSGLTYEDFRQESQVTLYRESNE